MDNTHKIKLCDFYIKYGRCNNGNNCTYAHGPKELTQFIKKGCNYGEKCVNEKCKFEHPIHWNPLNNKIICLYYEYGNCRNGEECKFLHIVKNNIEETCEQEKQLQLNLNNDIDNKIPVLVQKTNIKSDNILSYSDILKNNSEISHKEKFEEYKIILNNKEDIDKIKNKIKENSIYLYKLKNKKWEDYEDDDLDNIQNTENELSILKETYKEMRNINKNDIFKEEYLFLNTLFNIKENEDNINNLSIVNNYDVSEKDNEDIFPKISITINGSNIDKNDITFTNSNEKHKEDDLLTLIQNMENDCKIDLEKIKLNIDKSDIDHYLKIKLKTQLNKILCKINLFKENYKDTTYIN